MTVTGIDEDEIKGPFCYHTVKHRRRRSCTDWPCGLVFLFVVIFLIVAGVVAIIYGTPLRLLYGHDSFGNICGTTNDGIDERALTGLDMRDKPYVFSFDITNPRDSLKLCVSRCPQRTLSTLKELASFATQTDGATLCQYSLPPSEYVRSDSINVTASECLEMRTNDNYTSFEVIENYEANGCLVKILQWREGYGACPKLPVNPSYPILNRCVPSKSDAEAGVIYDFYAYLNSFDFFTRVMADLYASLREVVGLSFAALVLTLVLLGILYCATSTIIHVIVSLVVLGSVVGTSLLWWSWASLKKSLDSRLHFGQHDVLEEETKNEIILLVFAFLATAMTVALFLVLFLVRRRLTDVIRLFEEGSRCIREIPFLKLQPVWTFLLLVIFFSMWFYIMLCLATSEVIVFFADLTTSRLQDLPRFVRKHVTYSNHSAQVDIPLTTFTVIEYDDHTAIRYLWIVYVIALVLVSEFILACQQMIVAGAVSMWYFERDKKECHGPVLSAIQQTIFYHLGSVAMGSFLITLFKIPRIILLHIRRLLRGSRIDSSCSGCWWILDRFLKPVNHNAYAIVAAQGTSFFPSAAEAVDLMSEPSTESIISINGLADFMLFLGKCAVTAVIAIIGIISMKYDPQLHLFAIPLLLCCVFAYFIAHSVLSLYEMVIDTMFLCYREDVRIHDVCWENGDIGDAQEETTYFASPSLREFMHNLRRESSSGQVRREVGLS